MDSYACTRQTVGKVHDEGGRGVALRVILRMVHSTDYSNEAMGQNARTFSNTHQIIQRCADPGGGAQLGQTQILKRPLLRE